MSWRCPTCGQTLADEFGACWSCGTTRSLTPAEIVELDETDAVEARGTRARASEPNKAPARSMTPSEQVGWGSIAGALLALRDAHGHYRLRREHASQPGRRDLDRRWTQLYLAVGAFLGIVIATSFFGLSMDEPWMVWSYVGCMLLVIVTGSRATRAELRAKADKPRSPGDHAT